VTHRPILGDFLTAAHGHLAWVGGPAGTSAPGQDAEEIGASLYRLITTLTSYSADLTLSFGNLADPALSDLSNTGRVAFQVHDALSGAAEFVRCPPAGPLANKLAQRLDGAAVSLRAGRDLLQTHFGSDPHGRRRGLSSWSRVITSRPVAGALLGEITALARKASDLGALALPDNRSWPLGPDRRLRLACEWLALAAASGCDGSIPEPARDLLHAIPGCGLPPRRLPDGHEQVPELSDAVITTSERLSHLAWTAASTPSDSAGISVTSWRRIGSAATATSHHCHRLLTAMASRAAQGRPHNASATAAALEKAAARARLSRAAWLRTTEALGHVTTDVRWRPSRAAVEAADLALWTGRLAYSTPGWVPASGPRQPARRPEDLAPSPDQIPELVATVHYAADALQRLAASSHAQIRGAVRAHRVLTPAKTPLADPPGSKLFAPAPWQRTGELLDYYATVSGASSRTVTAVAAAARETGARSLVLATARTAVRSAQQPRQAATTTIPGAPEQAAEPVGPVESRMRELGITSPRLLWRAADVDSLARDVIEDATGKRDDRELPVVVRVSPAREELTRRAGTAARRRRTPTAPPREPRPSQREAEAEP
jgi:hypothetical protein